MMTDLGDGAAVKQISKKPMAMAGHGDEVTFFSGGYLQDFSGWIAHRQQCVYHQFLGAKFSSNFFQIGTVFLDLLGFSEFQLVIAACGKPIGNVQQEKFGIETRGQFGNMRQDGFIRWTVIEGDEDFFIHGWFKVARR